MSSNITVLNTGDSKDRRSQRTRETIVRTAERLFATHGVEGVSLNTITTAAHQNNRNAVQYHFGNKKGLLQAIFDKHSPNVMKRRHELIDQLMAEDLPMAIVAAKAMVLPLAELNATNTLNYFLNSEEGIRLQRETKLAELVAEQMNHIPSSLILQRFMLLAGFVFHSLSEHARIRNSDAKLGVLSDTELMVSNLIDSCAGLLSAGASDHSLGLINSLKSAGVST